MTLRKLLLRVMLGSLAAAAVLGVLAMLFFRETIIARVIGTALMTAVAAALLMALSLLADRENCRSAGTLGMSAVVAEFLLGLLMIWGLDGFGNYSWEDAVIAAMLTIAGLVLPTMFYLRMAYVPTARLAARVGIGVCGVVFLLFALPPWLSPRWYDYEKWFSTAMSLGLFGVAATGSLAGAGLDRRHWRYIGVLAAVVGAAMAIVGIWRDLHNGAFAFSLVASVAAVVAHANLALLCPLKPGQRWLAYVTIASAVLTAAGIDTLIYVGNEIDADLLGRLTGASGILASCGSLALLVLAVLNRKIKPKAILSQITEYTLICPGCNKKQTLPVGDARCPTCLLEMHVRFTEPRCPKCEYLLYMLQSDRCPECGTIVRGAAKPQDSEAAGASSPAPDGPSA